MRSIAVDVAPELPLRPLDPAEIEFGKLCTPHMFVAEYRDRKWSKARIQNVEKFSFHPASTIFHYGQAVFEGLKAYRRANGEITLFRPEENAKRFARSAARMGMPPVGVDLFLEAVESLVDLERDWIPEFPGSLYIRPTMIGTEPCLGVRSANEFMFFIITLPAGQYFKDLREGAGAIRVFVADSVSRAAPGGTGSIKASANYAVTLKTMTDARAAGCGQALFLDACTRGYVEEMGGMNVFFVQGDLLITPAVGDTILPGVTRDSILRIAPKLGLRVEERLVKLDEAVAAIKSGEITEVLACGTAAVVAAISDLVWTGGRTVQIADGVPGPVTNRILHTLEGIQFGTEPDPFNWVRLVPSRTHGSS
jgi:branched-chain amino acid aminotransferase